MTRIVLISLAILAALHIAPGATSAAGEGLRISPVRQFLSAKAGSATHNKFTVTNLTDKTLQVRLGVQQFSVADYTYDFIFDSPDNDWLRLGLTETMLEPGQSLDVPFTLTVPPDGRPGGYYYTLLASAKLSSQGLSSTIQAADLLYVTVDGDLIRTSQLEDSIIPRLVFGRDVAFTVQLRNTGNIHQFAFVTGELKGPGAQPAVTSGAHLLMPGKVRTLTGSIPAPILPGIYRATISYKTDAGQTVAASRMVVVVPVWFIAVLLGILLISGRFLSRRGRKPKSPPDRPADSTMDKFNN